MHPCRHLGWALGAAFALAAGAQTPATAAAPGQNIAGTVTNATSGAPLAHTPVSLVLLQNGMQTVATTTTSASGRYRFSQSSPGPYMVEAEFQNVPYFAPVTPGQGETNVKVYDAVSDAKLLQVDAEILVL
ncbi:MAG: carboxypeptidase-like regulatory domain-containing protein, partial [Terriglobales bacterium]